MSGIRVFLASWVVPVASPPVRDGFVAVSDGRVASFGQARDRPRGAEEVDLGVGVLMPGFVNAHTHLELSHLAANRPSGGAFVRWVEELLMKRAEAGANSVSTAIDEAIAGLERSGTAALVDISNTLVTVEPLSKSNLSALVLHEVLGWDPSKAEAVLEATNAQRRDAAERLTSNRVRIHVAAHAPHSISKRLAAGLVETGELRSVHLAESDAEAAFLSDGSGPWPAFLEARVGKIAFDAPRMSPVAYARQLGLLRPGVLAAHCVRVDRSDADALREAGVTAVLCPRSNAYLGNGVAPVEVLLDAGVPIAIGTDSLASAPSLDVLDDARVLARRFPRLPPATWIEALTRGGARAAGLDDVGAIAPGARAAMAFVEAQTTPAHPLAYVVGDFAPPRGVGLALA